MKEIDDRPDFIKKHLVGEGSFQFNGKTYRFAIVSKELEPALPGFLGFFQKKHLFISEEVPEAFRIPQLIHEIVEESSELTGKKGRCLEALYRELRYVQGNLVGEYIQYRRRFFFQLVNYYTGRSVDQEFLEEIINSLKYLKSI